MLQHYQHTQGLQHGGGSSRSAPTHLTGCVVPPGRARRGLNCQASAATCRLGSTGSSHYASIQRLGGRNARMGSGTTSGTTRRRGGRLVVKAMFERFTEKAIKVVMLAQEEARRQVHEGSGRRGVWVNQCMWRRQGACVPNPLTTHDVMPWGQSCVRHLQN